MAAIALQRTAHKSGLRPLDPTRDLQQVADLIQAAFASDLDQSGMAMLREMRQMGRFGPLLWWLEQPSSSLGQMMSGFVWVEAGSIVGNVTVTPVSTLGRKWVISNVAVAPPFRGRGIARRLMHAAIEHIDEQGGQAVTLQVRGDNAPALRLYRTMNFEQVFETAHLRLETAYYCRFRTPKMEGLRLRHYNSHDAYKSYRLARESTPEQVQTEHAITLSQYRLGWQAHLSDRIRVLLNTAVPLRLVVEREDRFLAILTAQPEGRQSIGRLSFVVHPSARGTVETGLVVAAVNHLIRLNRQTVLLQHPTYHQAGIDACLSLGFTVDKTLLWMRKSL